MRAIESAFHLDASAAQSGTDLVAPEAPALPLPAHRVVASDRTRFPHAEDSLQPMLAAQATMGILRPASHDRETLLPERKKHLLQEFVGGIDRAHSRQPQLLDQPVLQGLE